MALGEPILLSFLPITETYLRFRSLKDNSWVLNDLGANTLVRWLTNKANFLS